MKTADLIPLILLQLNTGDKYGLEITKNIETISNGKIVIKQPTLYTILKKLEKSKFISSYWEDSDIGGKRHYYKITNNGKAQVSTLPSFDVLLNSILSQDDDEISNNDEKEDNQTIDKQEENYFYDTSAAIDNATKIENSSNTTTDKYVSIFDILPTTSEESTIANTNTNTKPSILPSEDVFKTDSIDTATTTEINLSNSELLKSDTTNREEKFASNEDITKFTEKHIVSDEYKEKLHSIYSANVSESIDDNKTAQPLSSDIKYVDYRDFKTNKDYILAKKTTKNLLFKILSSSLYLGLMLIISAVITSHTGKSPIYYVMLILGLTILIFYPSIFAFNLDKLRLKYEFQPFKLNTRKRLITSICVEVLIIVASIILNVCLRINDIFNWTNFANFYSIIFLSSTIFADLIFTYIFMKKINKTN